MSEPVCVGIDVAKNSFEVAVTGELQTLSLGNDEAGHAELCQLLLPLAPRLVLHGQPLRRGDLVVPLIGAANRDPRRYAQPDVLDITRRDGSSLSFGSGPHVCIGAALTLMEAEIVFRQLLLRWPELSLVDAAPHWISNPLYRGLGTLPLRPRSPA